MGVGWNDRGSLSWQRPDHAAAERVGIWAVHFWTQKNRRNPVVCQEGKASAAMFVTY
jgi:hypothetical protein